ncbi:MAG: hypothetical protein AAGB18_02250 [Pseudomonadota bacterium]
MQLRFFDVTGLAEGAERETAGRIAGSMDGDGVGVAPSDLHERPFISGNQGKYRPRVIYTECYGRARAPSTDPNTDCFALVRFAEA